MSNYGNTNSEDSNESMVSSNRGVESPDFDEAHFQYQFNRHANSCNNDDAGKAQIKIFNLRAVQKDSEPGLTNRGIEETIKQSRTEGNREKYYNSNNVFVSCLYRTWCTAALLYSNGSEQKLTLKISPYMKEKWDAGFHRGNHPKSIYHMVEKFKKFLNYIKDKDIAFANNMPNQIILEVHQPEDLDVPKYHYNKKGGLYELESPDCGEEDKVMAKKNEIGFQENGNLQTFMDWHSSRFGAPTEPVHVVSHSKIMREYVINNNWSKDEVEPTISGTNCCMIRTIKDAQKDDIKFKKGYPKECIDSEKCEKGGDLCGKKGSVEPVCKKKSWFGSKNTNTNTNSKTNKRDEDGEEVIAGGKKKKRTRKMHKKKKETKKVVKRNRKKSVKRKK